jgi:spore coat protein U-like protein
MFHRKALRTACLMAACCATVFSPAANAASAFDDVAVTATVVATCTISDAGVGLGFGNYTGAQKDASVTLTVTCTDTTAFEIALDDGTTAGGSIATRKMISAALATLDYELYSDAGRTTNWGETAATDTVADTGDGLSNPFPIYGRIVAGQYPAPGNYSDTVRATVSY